jgi:DNA-binding response OmpR family regulator
MTYHILLIDNDPMIRRLFGGVLANAGFEVLYSENGNEGREAARRFQPDLILLDIRMPDTDGYVIARRLREEPKTSHIPIIFLTNEDISAEAEKAMKELWVEDYMHKSIDLKEFIKRIKKVLLDSKEKKK